MYLTLTNMGDDPEAMTTPDGSVIGVLHAMTATAVREDAVTVLIIGDKPEAREMLKAAALRLGAMLHGLISNILGRKVHARERTGKPEWLAVNVANHGANAVRVFLGDPTAAVDIAPGSSRSCDAESYLELRELGLEAS